LVLYLFVNLNPFFFFFFETVSHYIAQAGTQLVILLLGLLINWDCTTMSCSILFYWRRICFLLYYKGGWMKEV
jgi:hypothetical protein